MKRGLALLLGLLLLIPLGGKRGAHANFRELEQLLVVRTMGLDAYRGGVTLSLASSGDSEHGPRRLQADGTSVTAAMDRLSSFSYEQVLFCSQIQQLLIGEQEAEAGIGSALTYVERSPELRLDLPLFVVRGGTAREAVMDVGGGGQGICDVMDAVRLNLRRRGDCGLTRAEEVLRDERRCGSALVCALVCRDASESEQSDDGGEADATRPLTVSPEGYAVIRDGKLCRYLTREQGIAVGLLKNRSGVAEMQLRDKYGRLAVLELTGGSSRLTPVWEDGALTGLKVDCRVQANLVEIRGEGPRDETWLDDLTARFEAQIAGCLTGTLEASQELEADFLGLAAVAERSDPAAFRALPGPFAGQLPALSLEVTVRAQLNHSGDRKDV